MFVIKCFHILLRGLTHACFILYTYARGALRDKKPAKVQLFFDMTKYFERKMQKIFILS